MTGESPKQSRRSANERRAAAQAMRQQQLTKERRRRTLLASGGVLLVLVVIGVLVAVGLKDNHGGATAVNATVAQEVASVPASTLDTIGKGATLAGSQAGYAPTALTTAPLTENGKPKILYVGQDWCPYCAATRWSLAIALSRFGTLSHLGQVYSAADDGDLPSLSFHGATYTSPYLVFAGYELQDRNQNTLDKLPAADAKVYNALSSGWPFIDIGGKYKVGTLYNIELLSGMTQEQVAATLKDPSSPVAQAIDGSANVLTAAICKVTNNQPAAVCNSAGVRAGASTF